MKDELLDLMKRHNKFKENTFISNWKEFKKKAVGNVPSSKEAYKKTTNKKTNTNWNPINNPKWNPINIAKRKKENVLLNLEWIRSTPAHYTTTFTHQKQHTTQPHSLTATQPYSQTFSA